MSIGTAFPSLALCAPLCALLALDAHLRVRVPALGGGTRLSVTLASADPTVDSPGPWSLESSDGSHVHAAGGGGARLRFARSPSGWVVNGERIPGDALLVRARGGDPLRVGGRRYRGSILVATTSSGRPTVRNLVPLEDYVASVVGAELPRHFGLETARAQAVAARTFALYAQYTGRRLVDDARSQLYQGIESETRRSRLAALSTSGLVLTSASGELFPAYFHSTCGGATSSAEDVFGVPAPPPLAHSVRDPDCRVSPHFRWRREILREDLARLIGREDDSVFLVLDRLDGAGRVLTATLRDREGRLLDHLRGEDLRRRLEGLDGRSLPSCLFHATPTARGYVLDGRGLGHGVGMCQWGAEGMARAGADHRAILARFYPGARLAPARGHWSK